MSKIRRRDELNLVLLFEDSLPSLPVRVMNALRRTNIRTVGDLLDLDVWKWVDETKNIGFKYGTDLHIFQNELRAKRKKWVKQ